MTNLIFLISAPRSGSSLLQQIINTHPSVITLPEPWLMLPLVYMVKEDHESDACYNAKFARININRFIEYFPKGKEAFLEKIRDIALSIYDIVVDDKATYFLDKTPRYYHIIVELLNWFPEAKVILLTRNPVAVFCSIMDYNFSGKTYWLQNKDRFHDIVTAPKIISKFNNDERTLLIRYEDVVENTEQTLTRLFNYLKLDNYDKRNFGFYKLNEIFEKSVAIDTKSVKKHSYPVTDYINGWKKSVNSYHKKRLLLDYIDYLGEETFKNLGYSKKQIEEEVQATNANWSPYHLPFKIMTRNYGRGLRLRQQVLLTVIENMSLI